MEVTNTVTVTKHYEKCLNMLLHVVLFYFGGHMIRANRIAEILGMIILRTVLNVFRPLIGLALQKVSCNFT